MSRPEPTEAECAASAEIIARQNDQFRAAMPFGGVPALRGQMLVTPGVAALGIEFVTLLIFEVAGFATFDEDNDPWHDHGFGTITQMGEKVYWKIDLYDENYEFGSEEPENPDRTRRVLTLLLPSEY